MSAHSWKSTGTLVVFQNISGVAEAIQMYSILSIPTISDWAVVSDMAFN